MADGDEKIDHNDRVLVKNRVTDAKVEIQFNGCVLSWQPGETRSIQRVEAYEHYVRKSRIFIDPTGEVFPVERFAIVDTNGDPIEPGASAVPMTAAECKEIAKNGFIDSSRLPQDRLVGGWQIRDQQTGEFPTHTEVKAVPKGNEVPPPLVRPSNRAAIERELDQIEGAPV